MQALLDFEGREMAVASQPASAEWPELPDERPPLFPVELLPKDCAQLVEAIAASLPVPVDYPACALLGAVSAALVGRVVVKPREGHPEPIQLYQCMGGPSGTNKSGVMKAFIEPLREWLREQNYAVIKRNRDKARQRELLAEQGRKRGTTTEEKLALARKADEIEDEPEFERIEGDTTPEALAKRMKKQGGSAIIFTDEGTFINVLAGVTYGRQGGQANIDTVLKGWENGYVNIDRVTGECITIDRASLALTVGMQPGLIRRMTEHADLIDRGFSQRLLYYLPEPMTGADLIHLPAYPTKLLQDWGARLQTLAALHRDTPTVLSLTNDAQALYNQHRQDMHNRLTTDLGGNETLQAWARKAHGEAARLAGLLALLESPDALLVEESHVRAAVELMNRYYIPHAKLAFGGGPSLSPAVQAICEKLHQMDSFTESDMLRSIAGQKRFKGNAGKACFTEVLQELSAGGYIRRRPAASSTGRGRPPSPVWEVNPALHRRKD